MLDLAAAVAPDVSKPNRLCHAPGVVLRQVAAPSSCQLYTKCLVVRQGTSVSTQGPKTTRTECTAHCLLLLCACRRVVPAWLSLSQPRLAVQGTARKASESTGSSTVCHSSISSSRATFLFGCHIKAHSVFSSLDTPVSEYGLSLPSMLPLAAAVCSQTDRNPSPVEWPCACACILQLLAVVSSMLWTLLR
jgi:hypothetical protein